MPSSKLRGPIEHDTRTNTARSPAPVPDCDPVLRLMWVKGNTYRAAVADALGLSKSVVSETVQSLIRAGLVAEVGLGESSGGRRPVILNFQYGARCVLGVDVGATHVAVALTDLRGRVMEWRELSHPVRTDPVGTRRLILRLCDDCLAEWRGGFERLIGIGIAVPSPVDPAHPDWLSEAVIPDWQGRSDLERLHRRYGVPVFIDNDANLGALAEKSWGGGVDADNFLFVKLGRGIGAGVVIGGEVYRGANGVAGEIGHVPIDPNGQRCTCGLRGCLGTVVGSAALALRVRALLGEYADSALADQALSALAIAQAAAKGDALGIRVVHETAEVLAAGLSGYVHLMNPEMIIIGGGLARAGEALLGPMREAVRRSALVRSVSPVTCIVSQLGRQAVAVGAATLGLLKWLSTVSRTHNPTMTKP